MALIYVTSPYMDKGVYAATRSVAQTNNAFSIVLNTIVESVTVTELAQIVVNYLNQLGPKMKIG